MTTTAAPTVGTEYDTVYADILRTELATWAARHADDATTARTEFAKYVYAQGMAEALRWHAEGCIEAELEGEVAGIIQAQLAHSDVQVADIWPRVLKRLRELQHRGLTGGSSGTFTGPAERARGAAAVKLEDSYSGLAYLPHGAEWQARRQLAASEYELVEARKRQLAELRAMAVRAKSATRVAELEAQAVTAEGALAQAEQALQVRLVAAGAPVQAS